MKYHHVDDESSLFAIGQITCLSITVVKTAAVISRVCVSSFMEHSISFETIEASSRDDVNMLSTRRMFILLGVGAGLTALTGCGENKLSLALPGPIWPDDKPHLPGQPSKPIVSQPEEFTHAPTPTGVLTRSNWSRGNPVPTLMDRMTRIRFITVHHDGMMPFYSSSRFASASRLEAIRRAHRKRNWGDIGYHFAVDRAGRTWSCRPLQFQGAHVKDYNPGNIGIVTLGNFEQQQPSTAQTDALKALISTLMRTYRVPIEQVRTHQEWPSATLCPGRHLQAYMLRVRRQRQLG